MLVEREIIPVILAELSTPDILILLGSRQVGKTSILGLIRRHLQENNLQYVSLDLDLETNLEHFESYNSVISYIRYQGHDPAQDKLVLLLDEFQRAEGAGKILKNLYDHHPNIKIIATGSSSLQINRTISESMSGRKLVFRVYPLNFREFLFFKESQRQLAFYDGFRPGDEFPSFVYREFEPVITEKLIFGAFPEVVLEKSIQRKGRKIEDILNSYLRKDIKEQLGVRDTVQYKKVLQLLGVNIANLLNTNNIAVDLGTYHKKISEIIDMAGETYVIDLVRPLGRNRKTEITKNPKVYFEDVGMRNFLVRNTSLDIRLRPDTGALVENFVYNELIDKMDIFTEIKFRRTKNDTEIDFLLVKNMQTLPIEVKSGSHGNIPRSLLLFCKEEKLSRAVIANRDISKKITRDGIDFYFVPFIFSGKIVQLLNDE